MRWSVDVNKLDALSSRRDKCFLFFLPAKSFIATCNKFSMVKTKVNLFAAFVFWMSPVSLAQKEGFCGDCFCIPGPNETCPYELEPKMNFSSFLPNLLELKLDSNMTLDCDPYNSTIEECNLQPTPLAEGGACVVDLLPPSPDNNPQTACPVEWTYNLRTFPGSVQEAQEQGLYVTHAGACGACSTLQDLYVYMAKGNAIRDEATICGIKGISNALNGIQCFQDFGFTLACATTWYYNTKTTQKFCIDLCSEMYLGGMPPNGPPPSCNLHKCIECDEVNAGPIFAKYAGRTRRNSGLLSSIARKCSELVNLIQIDPCEFATAGSQADLSPDSTARPTNQVEIPGMNVMAMILLFLL